MRIAPVDVCVPKVLCGQTLFLSGARPEVELPGSRSASRSRQAVPSARSSRLQSRPQPRQRGRRSLVATSWRGSGYWAEPLGRGSGSRPRREPRCPGAIRAQHRWAQDSFIVAVSSIGLCRLGKVREGGVGLSGVGRRAAPGIRSRETSGTTDKRLRRRRYKKESERLKERSLGS